MATLEELMASEANDKKEKLLTHAQNEVDYAKKLYEIAKLEYDSAPKEYELGWSLLNLPIMALSIWGTYKVWPLAVMLWNNMSKSAAAEPGLTKPVMYIVAIGFVCAVMFIPVFMALLTFLWGIVIPISDYREISQIKQRLTQQLTHAEANLVEKKRQYRQYEAQ